MTASTSSETERTLTSDISAAPPVSPTKEGELGRLSDLPDFRTPPVSEVALGIQFDRLQEFQLVHGGLLWERYRSAFPRTEVHEPIDPAFETFGGRQQPLQFQFRIAPMSLIPRFWYLSEGGNAIIQVQPDRIVRNWRKTAPLDSYPRFEALRGELEGNVNTLCQFAKDEGIGEIVPNQCELTYVNDIVVGDIGADRTENLFKVWRNVGDNLSGSVEDVSFQWRYIMRDKATNNPIGRLVAIAMPALSLEGRPLIRFTLTARGAPAITTLDGALEFLDTGREYIVRAFAELTTDEMHGVWGREI